MKTNHNTVQFHKQSFQSVIPFSIQWCLSKENMTTTHLFQFHNEDKSQHSSVPLTHCITAQHSTVPLTHYIIQNKSQHSSTDTLHYTKQITAQFHLHILLTMLSAFLISVHRHFNNALRLSQMIQC
jgi:hypothetical protein